MSTSPHPARPGRTGRSEAPLPWWRFGMVWLVVAGPALVVVAGFATLAIAFATPTPSWSRRRLRRRRAARPAAPTAPALQARNHAATPRARAHGHEAPPALHPVAGVPHRRGARDAVFAVIDPHELRWFGGPLIGWTPVAIYSVTFLIFWAGISAASSMTALLALSDAEVNALGDDEDVAPSATSGAP